MSAGQTTRYRLMAGDGCPLSCCAFTVLDTIERTQAGAPTMVDHFRTRSGAEYAASLLNRGAARVDSHAIVGCKVVAS